MADIEVIRKKVLVEGWSIRETAQRLGHSRKTIRKALSTSEPPRYHLQKSRPAPVTGSFLSIIDAWLSADTAAPKKQRHTAHRIYQRLVEEYGFTGGESTIRRVVRERKQTVKEPFIPLEATPGEQAQIDWGTAQAEINGIPVTIHLFCLRLRASGVSFVCAYPHERMEAFLDGHRRAFEWLGGVPTTCLYDNLKSAVLRVGKGIEREEQETFRSLRTHYLFDSAFCRPGKGNEKGAVENLVGTIRRNVLVPVPKVGSLEDLNRLLLDWCEKERSGHPLWESEKAALRPLPAYSFSCSTLRPVKVCRLSLVSFEGNRYSVPTQFVGRTLFLRSFVDHVELVDKDQIVAVHPRCYGRGETILKTEHYLEAIARKPRSVNHAAAIHRLPEVFLRVRDQLARKSPSGYREFVPILLLLREHSSEEVAAALELAEEMDMLRADVVRQLIWGTTPEHRPNPTPIPESLQQYQIQPANPDRYNALLEEAAL